MDKITLNIFKVISLILIALAIIFQAMVLYQGDDAAAASSLIDNYITTSFVALIIAVLLAIIFPIIFIGQNPKNAIKIAIVLVGFVIVGFICYSIAGNSFNNVRLEELKTTASISKAVGAGLYFTYFVGSVAVLSVIFSGLSGFLK
jgi:hypothetical protein